MDPLLAVAGIITVAAITPGPNNFIVMAAAARGGIAAAVPPIVGVVGGSLALLAIAWTGVGALFEAAPRFRLILLVCGALYLAWLGVALIWRTRDGPSNDAGLPSSALGLALFQLLNPKSWVLILTATAAMSGETSGLTALAATLAAVTIPCLALWAFAGSAIAHWLRRAQARRRFDRAMGGLLIASAAVLAMS